MLETLIMLSIFLSGVMVGAGSLMLYGLWQLRRIRKAKTAIVNEIKKMAETVESKKDSIRDRLVQAHELAKLQNELRAQLEMPSKNAVHSRYKNGLYYEITELEQQKITILKSILTDGFDPMITVLDATGKKEELPLSAYVAGAEQALIDNGVTPKSDEPAGNVPEQAKKVGKFIVFKGGKDDGTSH